MTDIIQLCIVSLISFPTTAPVFLCQPPEPPCYLQTGQTYAAIIRSLYCSFLYLNALPTFEPGSLWPSSGFFPYMTFSERMLLSILYKELFLPPLSLPNFSSFNFLQSRKHNGTHCLLVSFLSIVWILCSHVLFTVVSQHLE